MRAIALVAVMPAAMPALVAAYDAGHALVAAYDASGHLH